MKYYKLLGIKTSLYLFSAYVSSFMYFVIVSFLELVFSVLIKRDLSGMPYVELAVVFNYLFVSISAIPLFHLMVVIFRNTKYPAGNITVTFLILSQLVYTLLRFFYTNYRFLSTFQKLLESLNTFQVFKLIPNFVST
jgi:hypothetical protein